MLEDVNNQALIVRISPVLGYLLAFLTAELVAGAPATSVLQAVKLTDSAQNTGIASVTNAGKLVGTWNIVLGNMSLFLTEKFVSGALSCTGRPKCSWC